MQKRDGWAIKYGSSNLLTQMCPCERNFRGVKNFPWSRFGKTYRQWRCELGAYRQKATGLVCEKPLGSRVFETPDTVIQPLSDEQIINGFLTPAVATLSRISFTRINPSKYTTIKHIFILMTRHDSLCWENVFPHLDIIIYALKHLKRAWPTMLERG